MAVRLSDIDLALDNLKTVLDSFREMDDEGLVEDAIMSKIVEIYGEDGKDFVNLLENN